MTKVTVELGRETAEVLAGDRSAPGFYNAELVLAQRLRGVLSEEDQEPGHRVELWFDDGIATTKLIHPTGGCTESTQCGRCAADLTDPDAKRCYDCEDMKPEECWLTGWFDDQGYELLSGKITFPVTAEWDQDHPDVRILPQREKASA